VPGRNVIASQNPRFYKRSDVKSSGLYLSKNKGTKRAPHTQPGEVVYVGECRSFEAKLQRLGSCGLAQCPSAAAAAILQGIGWDIIYLRNDRKPKEQEWLRFHLLRCTPSGAWWLFFSTTG